MKNAESEIKMNLFQLVRKAVVNNEVYGNEKRFEVKQRDYDQNIIYWITTKQKAFKVAKVERYIKNGEKTYEIYYKDVFTGCDFLERAYEALKYKKERAEKKGYTGEYANESVVNKFGHINDVYRDELQCKNYANSCYERLDKADDCCFELFLHTMGFENYEEYIKFQEKYNAFSNEDIENRYRDFLNSFQETREYADGYIY